MKKGFLTVAMVVMVFGLAVSSAAAAEKGVQKFSAGEIRIILPDGTAYSLKEGDILKWNFFVKHAKLDQVDDILLQVIESAWDGSPMVGVKVYLKGESKPREEYFMVLHGDYVDAATKAIQEAIKKK